MRIAGASLCLAGIVCCAVVATVRGGQCWSHINKNGRCTESIRSNVTQDECCGDSSATTAWSPKDLRSGDLFYWRSLGGGVVCKACKASCDGVQCGRGMQCVLRRQRPACVCAPKCSRKKRHLGEVCGSDGRTYRHLCRLLKRQCRKNKNLGVEYFGKCQKTCEHVQCAGRETCLLDQMQRPHCVRCLGHCPQFGTERVCGSDNATYSSACHLRQAACYKGRAVPVAYRGKCRADATCASIRCRNDGRCVVDPSGGPPRCITCPRRCPLVKGARVCATNNFAYPSWCHMVQDACKHGVLLEVRGAGACPETSSETNLIPLNMFEPPLHL